MKHSLPCEAFKMAVHDLSSCSRALLLLLVVGGNICASTSVEANFFIRFNVDGDEVHLYLAVSEGILCNSTNGLGPFSFISK